MRRQGQCGGGAGGASVTRVARRWLAVPALLALLLAACSQGPTRPASTATPGLASSQILRAALVPAPAGGQATSLTGVQSLDPAFAEGRPEQEIDGLLFDGLVTTDAKLGVEPWGASNIAVSSDGLTYTFTIRQGQFFSDGTPVTASDYAFSLDRTLNPCAGSTHAYLLSAIKDAVQYSGQECQNGTISAPPVQQGPPPAVITTLVGSSIVPNDANRTLTVALAHPAAYFVESLAASDAYALDPSLVGGASNPSSSWTLHLSDGPTGRGASGMYYLAGYVGSGSAGALHVTLKRNPHWWGLAAGNGPHLTEIDFAYYGSVEAAAAAYERDQVDVAYLPPDQMPQVPATPSATATPVAQTVTRTVPLLATYTLNFNWAVPPMNNADARAGLCLAIDRNALLRQASAADPTIQGISTWHIVAAGMPGYSPGLSGPSGVTSVAGDANAARAHWQAYVKSLGGAAVPTFVIADMQSVVLGDVQSFAWTRAIGTTLKADWQSVLGLVVPVHTYPVGGVQTNPPAYTQEAAYPGLWWPDYADPQDVLSQQYVPGAAYNLANVNDQAATALMQGADTQPDPTARMQEYQQAEQLLVREAAVCPLWQATETYETRSWVRGWSLTGMGIPANDAWLATAIVQH